ncbi:hypothetical protein CRUP_009837 [Coryphaenoides rupestris]|nr:hypothetical protein CRUP_009837 [Coryphaenoides rupestris]
MYSNSHPARHLAQTLSSQQYVPSPLYGNYFSDHHHHHHQQQQQHHHQVPELGDLLFGPPAAAWSFHHAGQASSYETPHFGGGSSTPPHTTTGPGEASPNAPRRNKAFEWIRGGGTGHQVSGGRTRTKDKYRVVYSDRQRLELETEFQCSCYISVHKKAQLSLELGLSERQVKIWFQNRRAKERKLTRRRLQRPQQASAAPGGDGESLPTLVVKHMLTW